MQDGRDGDEEVGYIANITDSTTIGFKSVSYTHLDVYKRQGMRR